MTEPSVCPNDQEGESNLRTRRAARRRASDGQLVLAAVVGIASAAAIGLVRPSLWFVALPLLCVGSFGVWGVAERTSAERYARLGPAFVGRRTLAGIRVTAALVGTLAGLLALLAVVARAIGTWIS